MRPPAMAPAARSWWMLDVSMCPSSVPSAGEQSLCLGLPLHLPFYVRMEVPPHTASPGSAFPCCQPPKPKAIPISLCQAVDRMCPIISTRSQPTPSRAAATKVPPRLRATPRPCNLTVCVPNVFPSRAMCCLQSERSCLNKYVQLNPASHQHSSFQVPQSTSHRPEMGRAGLLPPTPAAIWDHSCEVGKNHQSKGCSQVLTIYK